MCQVVFKKSRLAPETHPSAKVKSIIGINLICINICANIISK
jgi:hypothetical protein